MNRTYSQTEMEEAMKNVSRATAELTTKTVMTALEEKGLLKEDSEPGTAKKFLAGLLHKGTKHVTAVIDNVLIEGEEVLMKNAIKNIDEKAKARELKEATEAINKKYATTA